MTKPGPKIHGEWCDKFLEYYAASGRIDPSAKKAGVTRQAVYYRQKHDPEFKSAMWAVRAILASMLQDRAMSLALNGEKRAIVYRGQVVDYETRYHPELIWKLLKAFDPEGFGDNAANADQDDPMTRIQFIAPRGLENPAVGPDGGLTDG